LRNAAGNINNAPRKKMKIIFPVGSGNLSLLMMYINIINDGINVIKSRPMKTFYSIYEP